MMLEEVLSKNYNDEFVVEHKTLLF